MAKYNYFLTEVTCPACGARSCIAFQADIGVLDLEIFELGDLVIKTVPLRARRGRPIGPALDVDWEQPFWAVGIGDCSSCHQEVLARIDIRERRFSAARPTLENLGLFAWGPIDSTQDD